MQFIIDLQFVAVFAPAGKMKKQKQVEVLSDCGEKTLP